LVSEIEKHNNQKAKQLLGELGLEATDGYLRTPLINAASSNNLELMKWLIENGAVVNHQDRNGFSALHFTAQENKVDASKLLIENGADLDLKDGNGNTPLSNAVFSSRGDFALVNLLVNSGANLDNVNDHEITPRLLAISIYGDDFEKQLI
jgi:uncharacterized protein